MTSSIIKSTAFVFIVGLGACKVSKDTATPQAELPTSFKTTARVDSAAAAVSYADTASFADLSYKEFFGDPTLQALIDSAIVKNYDMQLAVKNIESARLVLGQSRLGYLPQVDLNVTANSSRPSDNSLNGLSLSSFLHSKHVEDYSANVSLSWEADIWGKIRNRQAGALASYLQTEEARKAVQTDIVAGVSQGYYNLLMLDAQLAIARRNVALNDSTLQIIKLQYSAGQVTALAVQQAEAQRLVAAGLVPQLEQSVLLQENALSILAGQLPGRTQRTLSLDEVPVKDNLSAGVPTALVSRRPDVKSYELALSVANANVGIAKASMYPTLTITASGGLNAYKASNWFNIPASLFGLVGGGLTEPLFRRRELKTRYELAKIDREKSVIQFRQSVLVAVGEVSDAMASLQKLKEQQVIVAARVTTLQQAITNSNLLFRNGLATYLEVITAQSNVLQSELELASLKRGQLNAVVSLYKSLGGGWK